MKNLIFLTGLTLNFYAFSSPGSWTPSNTIAQIIIENDMALVMMEGGVPSSYIPAQCNQPYNQVLLTTDNGKAVYSMVLSAKMAKQKVSLALDCIGSRPHISLIRLD